MKQYLDETVGAPVARGKAVENHGSAHKKRGGRLKRRPPLVSLTPHLTICLTINQKLDCRAFGQRYYRQRRSENRSPLLSHLSPRRPLSGRRRTVGLFSRES